MKDVRFQYLCWQTLGIANPIEITNKPPHEV